MNPEIGKLQMDSETFWSKSPLHRAVYLNDLEQCDRSITSGECVNKVHSGMTPLHVASLTGNVKIAKTLLLKHSCDVNACTMPTNCTPLQLACNYGHAGMVELLLQYGADISKYAIDGATVLYSAIATQHQRAPELLVKTKVDVNERHEQRRSLLTQAALTGNARLTRLLLEAKCDVNIIDNRGNTLLHFAVNGGHRVVTNLLVEAGADVNMMNAAGNYPIHLASSRKDPRIMNALIKAGCDVNVKVCGITPILSAVYRQDLQAVRMLIEGGADIDAEDEAHFIPSPLLEAIRDGNPNLDIVCELIRGGCNISAKSFLIDCSPLMCAVLNGHRQTVMALIQADCDRLMSEDVINHLYNKLTDRELIQVVIQLMVTPRSLLHACRRTIRGALGYGINYGHKVESLCLPKAAKNFLKFTELPNIVQGGGYC